MWPNDKREWRKMIFIEDNAADGNTVQGDETSSE